MIRLAVASAAAFGATIVFAGSASAQSHTQHVQPTQPVAALVLPRPAQQQEKPDTTITIRSFGTELEFQPANIAVKAGKRLRIRYVNEGTFPHNIVVMKSDNDIDPLGNAAFNAGSTGYVPVGMKERMVAFSPLVAPGATVEFTFVVPAAGEYPFACLYPGHYNMMLGTLKSLR
jgi:uncharacterized cupredoxin-like copper-binding protein